ncbi:MAG: hypothetical protein M3120_11765 [Pseudomonadota bacterium]|nr:hypothetical protein [Pseudomonadota bacterium]
MLAEAAKTTLLAKPYFCSGMKVFAGPQTEIHEFIWGEITILKLPAHGRLDCAAMDVILTNDSGFLGAH